MQGTLKIAKKETIRSACTDTVVSNKLHREDILKHSFLSDGFSKYFQPALMNRVFAAHTLQEERQISSTFSGKRNEIHKKPGVFDQLQVLSVSALDYHAGSESCGNDFSV